MVCMSEEIFVHYCSPTLAGIKTANLFSCRFADEKEMRDSIRRLNVVLVKKGIRVLPLRYRDGCALIYAYRNGVFFIGCFKIFVCCA